MKKSESIQLELNFDGENISVNNDENVNFSKNAFIEKKNEKAENVDYSFNNRLSNKKTSSEEKIYKEIILLARHI